MAINTYKVGLLVGQLMKELLEEEEFHKGYQAGMNPDPESLKMLRDANKNGAPNMMNVKIQTIKKLREETGMGLKEAKDQVEEWMEKLPKGLI